MRIKHILFALFVFAMPLTVCPYIIDGQVDDWGIFPSEYASSDWEPNAGVLWTEEDSTGPIGAYLDPGFGGQNYDAEAMYFDFEGDYAYLAIVTGVSSSATGDRKPGDIGFDFGSDGVYEYGIRTTETNAGNMYKDASWTDTIYYPGSNPHRLAISGSNYVGAIDFAYTLFADSYTENPDEYWWRHYVLEARIPLNLFEYVGVAPVWDSPFSVHWTMGCGNDSIDLDIVAVPEPTTTLLFVLGIFGLFGRGFKKNKEIK